MMLSTNNQIVKERWKPMKPIRKFTRRLKRLFKWTPVIWKDEDWDYEYFLIIAQFKLEQMAELHVKEGDAMNSKLYASEMLHASHLLLQAIEGADTPSLDTDDIENQKRIDEAFKYISKNLTKWWD